VSLDVDGKFGRIWMLLKMCFVNSPDDFIAVLKRAFTTGKTGKGDKEKSIRSKLDKLGVGRKVKVFELFSVPDYQKQFNFGLRMDDYEICISKCFKTEHTQLQWTFEAIDTEGDTDLQELYPNGVKVTYRKC